MTIGNGPISFNLAKAYGLQAAIKPQPVQPVSKTTPATPPPKGVAAASTRTDSLAAATVPGKVSFDAPPAPAAPRPEAFSPLQMYSRPSDRNAVATAVAVGRSLDIQG